MWYDDSTANKAFVFRIYPSREWEVLMNRTFGCCRFVWNRMLTDRKIRYLITRDSIQITPAQCKNHWPWLKEVGPVQRPAEPGEGVPGFLQESRSFRVPEILRAGIGTGTVTPPT
ncbi:MAG: helix-turn-helix domain-containing protein [Deltaproteobacteria bacterium]|nr:helix-turn-helix domain-containing protein [Deltaproteobacteria bacterium]